MATPKRFTPSVTGDVRDETQDITVNVGAKLRGAITDQPAVQKALRITEPAHREHIMRRIATEVMLPSFRKTVEAGGRPSPYAPLTPLTVQWKKEQRMGGNATRPLMTTSNSPLMMSLQEGGPHNVLSVEEGGMRLRVGSTHPHVAFAQAGTSPHWIPKAYGHAGRAWHPGTPPRPVIVMVEEDFKGIARIVEEEVSGAL